MPDKTLSTAPSGACSGSRWSMRLVARWNSPSATQLAPHDPVGGGPCGLKPGERTDDTSLALCLADSLIACGGLDQRDLMQRFVRWWRDGKNSPTGYDGGRIVSAVTIIAVTVTTEGRREIVGLGIGPSDTEPFWPGSIKS
jgi:hypothetical protein